MPHPSELAERLSKTLIHRNVPGERIHRFLADFDRSWAIAAPQSVFGPRQRWVADFARRDLRSLPTKQM